MVSRPPGFGDPNAPPPLLQQPYAPPSHPQPAAVAALGATEDDIFNDGVKLLIPGADFHGLLDATDALKGVYGTALGSIPWYT